MHNPFINYVPHIRTRNLITAKPKIFDEMLNSNKGRFRVRIFLPLKFIAIPSPSSGYRRMIVIF